MRTWGLKSLVLLCVSLASCQAAVRTYYVQAEKQWYSFADGTTQPTERGLYINQCTGTNYSGGSELYMQVGVGSRYLVARYVRYMDPEFTVPYEIPREEDHLNLAGPMMRVEEGDQLVVVFSNTLEFNTTLTANGVRHSYNDSLGVLPNTTTVYNWTITHDLAPPMGLASSKLWLYGPYTDHEVQRNMGLFGPLIVTRKGWADPVTAKPIDTDLELFAMFHIFDQTLNPYFNDTLTYYNMLDDYLTVANVTAANWAECNLKHSINGKMFCWNNWNDGFTIPAGSSARWHTGVFGAMTDIHNLHWHGMVLNISGSFADQYSMFSGATTTADMVTDNPGTWLFHCHINDHIHAGMIGYYKLNGTDSAPVQPQVNGDINQYYVAADIVEWDYAPSQMNMCGDEPQNFTDAVAATLTPNNYTLTIGSKQMKCLYREYTDATFTTLAPMEDYLGMMGPTLRGKVGDTLQIGFQNNCPFTTGMHPHGVFYMKDSEGAPYDDGEGGMTRPGNAVHQGQQWNYTWYITERAAPGPLDGSSVTWLYHGHTHEVQDTYAGVMGAIIVVDPKMATADNRPKDVDKEYVLSYSIMNEADSFMLRTNLEKYMPNIPALQYYTLAGTVTQFQNQENFYAMNGYVFCNGPTLNATMGDRVRVYISTLGTEADMHTPSSTFQWTQQGHRSSALLNIAGDMQTADIVPLAAGDYLIKCRTDEHLDNGMIAKFRIQDSGEDLLSAFNGTERYYYIAANEVMWDYIPQNIDACTGKQFTDDVSATWGNGTLGKVFLKAIYQGYTDDSFTEMTAQPAAQGMAGPTMHAEVGDMIHVVFFNNLTFEANLQLNGGFIPLHNASLIDTAVEPGDTVSYTWLVQPDNGPDNLDLSTVAYAYGSNVDTTGNYNAGLFGASIVGSAGALNASDLPSAVDAEQALFFFTMDESQSSLFQDNLNLQNFSVPDMYEDYADYETYEAGILFNPINGYAWCNLPPVQMNVTNTIRWYLIGLGQQLGEHTPIFENGVLQMQGNTVVTSNTAPTLTTTADMEANMPGTWLYWDDVREHFEGGMMAQYVVSDPNSLKGGTAN